MCLAPIFLPQLATGVFFLFIDNYLSLPVKFIKDNSDNSNDDNDSTTDE